MTVQANSLERLDQRNFVLLGESRLSFLFWDVYDARLYVTDDFYQPDKPFALTLHYLRIFRVLISQNDPSKKLGNKDLLMIKY